MQKLRSYNSKTLADIYAIVMQFQSQIEHLVNTNEDVKDASDLPKSVIPTETLYAITICYDVMFNLLMAEHLIKDGHIKPSNTIH
jgi:hypothetical protein